MYQKHASKRYSWICARWLLKILKINTAKLSIRDLFDSPKTKNILLATQFKQFYPMHDVKFKWITLKSYAGIEIMAKFPSSTGNLLSTEQKKIQPKFIWNSVVCIAFVIGLVSRCPVFGVFVHGYERKYVYDIVLLDILASGSLAKGNKTSTKWRRKSERWKLCFLHTEISTSPDMKKL